MARRKEETQASGCHIHPNCLDCPLSVCIMELSPREARRAAEQHRTNTIHQRVQEMIGRGMTKREAVTRLTEQMGLKDASASNIYRRLKRHRLAEGQTAD